MTEQHIADRYLDAWNRHDAQGILDCFHKDGVYIDANLDHEISAEQFARRAQELFDAFPELRIEVDQRTQSSHTTAHTPAHTTARSETTIPSSTLIATPWRIVGALPNTTLAGVDMLCIHGNKLQSVQVYFDLPTGKLFAKVPSLHLNYRPDLLNHPHVNKASAHSSKPQSQLTSPLPEKYRYSGLTQTDMLAIKQQLEAGLTEQQWHLQTDISLARLAQFLDVSTNHLSQVINSQYRMNYYDFINHHRIAHAKVLLANDTQAKLTSLVVSLESGFKSTSTFYTAFKKETGLTPSQFRQRL